MQALCLVFQAILAVWTKESLMELHQALYVKE